MLNIYQKNIEKFGLSANEVKIYISLVQHGAGTASEIATLAGLNRSTTYVQLTSLIAHGLANSYKIKKKTFFSAESPKNLERLLDNKISKIENQKINSRAIISELLRAFDKTDTRAPVRIFEGKEGLRAMGKELLVSGVSEYHAAYSFDEINSVFSGEEIKQYNDKRIELGIHEYLICNKISRKMSKLPLQDIKIVKKEDFPLKANIYVYGKTVSIASISGKSFGMTITNEHIANSVRSLFLLAWLSK